MYNGKVVVDIELETKLSDLTRENPGFEWSVLVVFFHNPLQHEFEIIIKPDWTFFSPSYLFFES